MKTTEMNLVSVSETASQELAATGARLTVRISGQSFVTGTAAFKKAAEVAACIAALKACGVTDDEIRLLNVAAEVETGFLTKSSSATYDLEINCSSIENLSPVMAAIASQKNAKILSVNWDYPDVEQTKQDVLQAAVRKAKASAAAIGEALGETLLGVHRLSYDVKGLASERTVLSSFMGRSRMKMALEEDADLDAGLTFSHTTRIRVTVTADFRLASS